MYQDEYEKKAIEVLRSGWYIIGNEVQSFEKNLQIILELNMLLV